MGIVSRMIRPKAASWGPTDDRWYLPGGAYYGGEALSSAGVTVGTDSAMRLITVQNCVTMRAKTIERLPCHIMKHDGRMKEKAEDFYLYELLYGQPNSWMTAAEFWSMAEAHVCLKGNFYAYKLGLEGRPIQELIPLGVDAVTKIEQNKDRSLTYHIRFSDGEIKPIDGNKLMHLRCFTIDGVTGVNPIEYARETIGIGLASNQFLGQYFSKGMHPGAVLKHPLILNAPEHANMKANFKEKYTGLGKSHEFMLIDEGMDITFPTINLVDQQFLENMKLNEAQICGLFRVPLMLVNGGDKSPTYASAEQFMLFYQMFSIDVSNYEAAIRRDLLTPQERKKYYAKFEMKALQRGSFKEQMEGFAVGIDKEVYSPNEVRAWLDMNPRTDPGGDEYKTRTSTVRDTGSQNKGATKE